MWLQNVAASWWFDKSRYVNSILDSFQTTTFSQEYLFSFMKLCFCFCKVLCPMLEWIHIIEWCFCLLLQNSFVLKLFLSISYLQMEKNQTPIFKGDMPYTTQYWPKSKIERQKKSFVRHDRNFIFYCKGNLIVLAKLDWTKQK